MAKTNYFIQDGLIVKKANNDNDEKGLFSLVRFFKRMLKRFHVSFVDDCCDDTIDTTAAPIRFNRVTGHIQYYNATTDTWTNATL